MKKKIIHNGKPGRYIFKDILVFDDPGHLKGIMNKLSWQILQLLSEKEMYPIEIAKKLRVHEQKVYYHLRKLVESGIVKIVRTEQKKGAVAKYYRASFPAFGVELPFGHQITKTISIPRMSERMKIFFIL